MISEIRLEMISQKIYRYTATTRKYSKGTRQTQIENLDSGVRITEAWYDNDMRKEKEKITFHCWDKIRSVTIIYEE